MCFNTFIQYVSGEHFQSLGFKHNSNLHPRHWFQYADDASITTALERENQILLNAFTKWCEWSMMTIRVDKCKTFGTSKKNTQSKQFLPKVYVNNELIPQVKEGESFTYLGRHYNFEMDEQAHRDSVVEITNDLLKKIDELPLHPKNKLLLYNSYLLSKISWDLTIADLGLTWVKSNIDNMVSSYFRKWLEIPINGTLEICLLSRNKFGLEIIMPSLKYMQCQSVLRNNLKYSINSDIQELHKETSKGKNVQFDQFNSTKQVLKSFRKNSEDKIQNELSSQGALVSIMWKEVLNCTLKFWSITQSSLPRNIYNFTVRYLNNTLATRKNMVRWGQTDDDRCSFCSQSETLLHIVAGCKVYLEDKRYTWRHDSILLFLSKMFSKINNIKLFSDLNDFNSPCIITGHNLRPDMLVIHNRTLYVLELTVGFELNLRVNASRKECKYSELVDTLSQKYDAVKFVNLSMGALGVFGTSCDAFITLLDDLKITVSQRKYLLQSLSNIAIRCTYFIFCMRNKPWTEPSYLELW